MTKYAASQFSRPRRYSAIRMSAESTHIPRPGTYCGRCAPFSPVVWFLLGVVSMGGADPPDPGKRIYAKKPPGVAGLQKLVLLAGSDCANGPREYPRDTIQIRV